ncbi:F-box/RNI superfamily protein [Medicago truncatula]|uniref:F-box/RNI superfamily protein n=1 Tax=Medicago truncatula TaxID=3880 RepID=G7KP27_MEDTR|nr:F-box/RNI superfamily protein [Medicago truncatula]
MKRKRTCSLKSCSPNNLLTKSPEVSDSKCSYLPDECWEIIFRFIHKDGFKQRCLNSLSFVSKEFLSIIDRRRFSLIVKDATGPFLGRLLKRFTNLNSLDLSNYNGDLDMLLHKISPFPLKKLTSLSISNQHTFPANGLRAFSQNITTLASLDCSNMFLYNNDLLLIADCFPMLKELNLGHPLVNNQTNFINGIHCMLSKWRCIQHLNLRCTYFLNDEHVSELSWFLRDLLSVNLRDCWMLTELALYSLVRNCPSLSEFKMEYTAIGKESVGNSSVYPQLKSLYLGRNLRLTDEKIVILASFFPNLQLLDLNTCNNISEGICQVLRRCSKIKHLNLAHCSRVKLLGMNFVVRQLEVLNLSDTKVDDETLHVISKNCCGLLELLLKDCYYVTNKAVKHVEENCTQLRLFSNRGCLLC